MHHACAEEHDMPCNAYCEGDVHADIVYFNTRVWDLSTVPLPVLCEAFQQHADCMAAQGAEYPVEALSLQPAPEAPPITTRYCNATQEEAGCMQAYLVRYRLRTEAGAGAGGGIRGLGGNFLLSNDNGFG